jgi:hypothetical protein
MLILVSEHVSLLDPLIFQKKFFIKSHKFVSSVCSRILVVLADPLLPVCIGTVSI